MSDYEYETGIGRLDIKTSYSPKLVFVWVHEDTQQAAIHIPNEDVPTVAAELLKAAGHVVLAGNIEAAVAHSAEVAASGKKRQERRDALAPTTYAAASLITRTLIDQIVEQEDEQAV